MHAGKDKHQFIPYVSVQCTSNYTFAHYYKRICETKYSQQKIYHNHVLKATDLILNIQPKPKI